MAEATAAISTNTRTMRGLGANYDAASATVSNINIKNLRWTRIPWSFVDDETVTAGSGKVPRGVVVVLTECLADDDPASVFWNPATQTGTVATDGSTHLGWMWFGCRRR